MGLFPLLEDQVEPDLVLLRPPLPQALLQGDSNLEPFCRLLIPNAPGPLGLNFMIIIDKILLDSAPGPLGLKC